jgi:hypothetical protein
MPPVLHWVASGTHSVPYSLRFDFSSILPLEKNQDLVELIFDRRQP